MPRPWADLEENARAALDETLAGLPPDVQHVARELPCLLQEYAEGDLDLLGVYGGFAPGELSDTNGPIILYLRAIEAFCEEEGEDFTEQVQLTYLHELGHHLGWDEGDLEERGLE